MPTKDIYIQDNRIFEYDDTVLFFNKYERYVRLRKVDSNWNYDRVNGSYPASGTIIFPNFRADNITELYSFEHEVEGSGTVDYQLSNDNGTTFYYVQSSGTWIATSSGFSSLNDVDANLHAFPLLYPKQIRIKARLNSVESRKETPILNGVFIGYEHDSGFTEDIERSVSRFICQRLLIQYETKQTVDSGTTSYSIDVPEGGTFYDAVSIFNITTDENRQTNLVSSYSSDGTITISTAQATGILLIKHRGTVPVYLFADYDLDDSVKPSIIIRRKGNIEQKTWKSGDDLAEISISRMQARIRPHPDFEEVDLEIECQHGSYIESVKMADAVRKLFSSRKQIPSFGTGQDYKVRVYDPVSSVDRDIKSNLVSLKIYGYNDVVLSDPYTNESGSELISDREFAGSGTENRYESVPLISEDGIDFNIGIY